MNMKIYKDVNIGIFETTVNNAFIKWAKINGYKFYMDHFFKVNVTLENNETIQIKDYIVVNDEIIATMKVII